MFTRVFLLAMLGSLVFVVPGYSQTSTFDCYVWVKQDYVCERPVYIHTCQLACVNGQCRFNDYYKLKGSDYDHIDSHITPGSFGQSGHELDAIVQFECVLGGDCKCILDDGAVMCRMDTNNEPLIDWEVRDPAAPCVVPTFE